MSWQSIYFPLGKHFLELSEIRFIEDQLKEFPMETITIGDAGEINNCQVGRLMEDQPGQVPKLLNSYLSKPVLEHYSNSKAYNFFKGFLNNDEDQFIRRSQFNLLGQGSFVGRHLDIDSNPDYQIAAVLQLGSVFSGGNFIVYPKKESNIQDAQIIAPEYGSLTVSFCAYEHEVEKVSSGVRTSFVCFISNSNSKNRRQSL